MNILRYITLISIISVSFFLMWKKENMEMLYIMSGIVGLLLLFSVVWRLMDKKKSSSSEEIKKRTITWWWMVAISMLALSFNRIISFIFLGFLCFMALREYFSLIPMSDSVGTKTLSFKDRPSIFLSYISIPLMIYLAYIEWYDLFIIVIPVYIFLMVPILFVIQNRTEGSIKSIGIITLGLMFFVHNLGHCLFMINLGSVLIMYCFVLTEVRDLLSFWIGKCLGRISSNMNDSPLKRFLEYRVAKDVSPNKTWATGLLSAVIISIVSLAFVPIMPHFPDGRLSAWYCLVTGFAIGIFGLFGDLVFSMVKRDMNSKDTGSLLPGHGGIIDRVDSLVFTIPITFHMIYWMYY